MGAGNVQPGIDRRPGSIVSLGRARPYIKTNSPDCIRSSFTLDFVPEIGDVRHQWNPHNPLAPSSNPTKNQPL